MGTTIIITEKPSVARSYISILQINPKMKTEGYTEGYSPYLEKNVIVTHALGHLVVIADPKVMNPEWEEWKKETLPIIPKDYKYKYEPVHPTDEDKQKRPNIAKAKAGYYKQFCIVKKLFNREDVNEIYYAGDPAREGIYIQALIRMKCFNGKPKKDLVEKVVWVDSITEKEIKKGIKEAKPFSSYTALVNAGYARAIADHMVGINYTRAYTLCCGGNVLLNAGRVVTPTLAIVVRRERELNNFVKEPYYGIKAVNKELNLNWKAVEGSAYADSDEIFNENGFRNKEDALKLISKLQLSKQLIVNSVKKERKEKYAPNPFNQTRLQTHCSKKFNISPKEVLDISQELYEKKLISYPRTSSEYLSTGIWEDLKSQGYNVPERYVNDKKVEDHYAIIPTFNGGEQNIAGLSKQVYEVILNRFMNLMKPPYVYDAVSVTYKHKNGELFFDSFSNVIDKGWKNYTDDEEDEKNSTQDSEDEEKIREYINRPIPVKGDVIDIDDYILRSLETKPPAKLTTGSLVREMEQAGKYVQDKTLKSILRETKGIGTDATRAEIVDKLIRQRFITVASKQVVHPTELGIKFIDIVEKYDDTLASPEKTAKLENDLSLIADNQMKYMDFLKVIDDYVRTTTKKIIKECTDVHFDKSDKGTKFKCPVPDCGGTVQLGKYGYYCSNWKECGMNFNKVFGHELTSNQVKNLLSGKEIKYTENGKTTIVVPQVYEHEYNGKTYRNWATRKPDGK